MLNNVARRLPGALYIEGSRSYTRWPAKGTRHEELRLLLVQPQLWAGRGGAESHVIHTRTVCESHVIQKVRLQIELSTRR